MNTIAAMPAAVGAGGVDCRLGRPLPVNLEENVTTPKHNEALSEFTNYFVKNYPGPNTVISKPEWHAPKIFRAAEHAINSAKPKEWRCFHCNEVLTTEEEAKLHFGEYQDAFPICRVGAEVYRQMEAEVQRYRSESDIVSCQFYQIGAEHTQALQCAEEKGYARGLTDALADAKVEWIVSCGSASVAPNPRFDNEADAVARYHREKATPSYFGPGHQRQASVHKVTTIVENVTSDCVSQEDAEDTLRKARAM